MLSFRSTLSSILASLTMGWATLGGCPANGDLAPTAPKAVQQLDLGLAEVELKLVPNEKLLLVEVYVGSEGPFLFSVDTGFSGRACLSEGLRQQLRLPRARGMLSDDGGGRLGYQSGARLPEIRVGSLVVKQEFKVLVADLEWLTAESGQPVDGILGFGFFADYLLQLDVKSGVVRLFRGSLPRENNAQTLRFRLRRGVPYCWMTAGTHTFPLLVDSGFDGSLTLPGGLRSQIQCFSEPRVTGHLRTTNSQDRRIYTARLKVDAKLAGFGMAQPPVQFLEGYRSGVLGAQALRQFVVTLDRSQQRVHFALPRK